MTFREIWQCDEPNRQRGFGWQDRLYKHNQAKIDDVLASQKDFGQFGNSRFLNSY